MEGVDNVAVEELGSALGELSIACEIFSVDQWTSSCPAQTSLVKYVLRVMGDISAGDKTYTVESVPPGTLPGTLTGLGLFN
jgi:hypothetical protein